jgi:hypothetical protein
MLSAVFSGALVEMPKPLFAIRQYRFQLLTAHLPSQLPIISFARLQMMQRDFWGTIEPYGNDGRTCTDRRVSNHVTIFPSTRAHVSRKNRTKSDRDAAWKTNLTTVGVPAQR